MTMRDPGDDHRAATPLELLFDLTVVVAVSFAAVALHHNLSEGHLILGPLSFLVTFFGLWWAWMNFTWFATAFDTDDWLYRIATIVQMGGALTFAAGIPAAMNLADPSYTLCIIGYVIMRLPMAFQWFRAAHDDRSRRTTALFYGWGVLIVQTYWLLLLLIPTEWVLPTFALGAILELLVPVVAERSGVTARHPHHITERYGLFTLIVLGESILASTNAVVEAGTSAEHLAGLILLAATSLVIIAAFWWLYFALPQHELLTDDRTALRWGYGHFLIFAAAAALSAGIELTIDQNEGHSDLTTIATGAMVALPAAVFVLVVWFLVLRPFSSRRVNVITPILAGLIAASSLAPFSLQIVAVLLVITVIVVVTGHDEAYEHPPVRSTAAMPADTSASEQPMNGQRTRARSEPTET
jgi:low temperature requirement protein LtrA